MKPGRTKIYLISLVAIITLITVIFAFGHQWVGAYYDEVKYNRYKTGDTLYAKDQFIERKSELAVVLEKFKAQSGGSDGDDVSYVCGYIKNNKLRLLNQRYIGTYLYTKFLPFAYKGENYVVRLYAVRPSWKVTDTAGISIFPRSAYSQVDTNYYITADTPFLK